MAKPLEGKVRAIRGPYAAGKRWQVQITLDSGRYTSRTFKYKDSAERFMAENPASEPPKPVGRPKKKKTGAPRTSRGWFKLLSSLAAELVNEDNVALKKELRADLQAVANASRAVKALYDQGELERRVQAMEGRLKQIRRARKHDLGTRGETRSAGGAG